MEYDVQTFFLLLSNSHRRLNYMQISRGPIEVNDSTEFIAMMDQKSRGKISVIDCGIACDTSKCPTGLNLTHGVH